MSDQKRFFDVWFVKSNTVYKEVPFQVVTDWAQQARLSADDMLKPTGTASWFKVGTQPLFEPYLPRAEPQKVGDAAEALEPVELDIEWKKRSDDDDDDVDMIPLIDISLVLLIFFMMTTTVSSVSRIFVPTTKYGSKLDSASNVLRVDIDMDGNTPIYGLGLSSTAPPEGIDANLSDVTALMLRLDAALASHPDSKPEVRIAAHQKLPYHIVERVMKELDKRRDGDQIREYAIEVNEKRK